MTSAVSKGATVSSDDVAQANIQLATMHQRLLQCPRNSPERKRLKSLAQALEEGVVSMVAELDNEADVVRSVADDAVVAAATEPAEQDKPQGVSEEMITDIVEEAFPEHGPTLAPGSPPVGTMITQEVEVSAAVAVAQANAQLAALQEQLLQSPRNSSERKRLKALAQSLEESVVTMVAELDTLPEPVPHACVMTAANDSQLPIGAVEETIPGQVQTRRATMKQEVEEPAATKARAKEAAEAAQLALAEATMLMIKKADHAEKTMQALAAAAEAHSQLERPEALATRIQGMVASKSARNEADATHGALDGALVDGAMVIQAGFAGTRRILEDDTKATTRVDVPGAIYGEYIVCHTWLQSSAGIYFLPRGTLQNPAGVIVSHVKDATLREDIKLGMHLLTVNGEDVTEQSCLEVEKKVKLAKTPLTLKFHCTEANGLLALLYKRFTMADKDGSGALDKAEIAEAIYFVYRAAKKADPTFCPPKKDVVDLQTDKAMEIYDADGSGHLEFAEFVDMACHSPTFDIKVSDAAKEEAAKLSDALEQAWGKIEGTPQQRRKEWRKRTHIETETRMLNGFFRFADVDGVGSLDAEGATKAVCAYLRNGEVKCNEDKVREEVNRLLVQHNGDCDGLLRPDEFVELFVASEKLQFNPNRNEYTRKRSSSKEIDIRIAEAAGLARASTNSPPASPELTRAAMVAVMAAVQAGLQRRKVLDRSEMFGAVELAASRVQGVVRGSTDRQQMHVTSQSASRVQAGMRGVMGREALHQLAEEAKRGDELAPIHAVMRGAETRRSTKDLARSSIVVQGGMHGRDARRHARLEQGRVESEAAVAVQAALRGRVGRNNFQATYQATDAAARHIQGALLSAADREAVLAERMVSEHRATVSLQGVARGCKARKSPSRKCQREEMDTLAAERLSAGVQAMSARRDAKRELTDASQRIQAGVRTRSTSQWAAQAIGLAQGDAQARLAALSRGFRDRKSFDVEFKAQNLEDTSPKTRQECRLELLLRLQGNTSVIRRDHPSLPFLNAEMPWGKPLVKSLRVHGRNAASRKTILARLFEELAQEGFVDSDTIHALATARRMPGQNESFWPSKANRTRWEVMRPLLAQLEDAGKERLSKADFVSYLNKEVPQSMEHFDAIAAGFFEVARCLAGAHGVGGRA